jgi:hypothetical protein
VTVAELDLQDNNLTKTDEPDVEKTLTEENQENTRYKTKWSQMAWSKIERAYKVKNKELMPLVRNRLINRAYAEIYLKDREAFKWAGLAVFASHLIGDRMRLLRELSGYSTATLFASFGTALPVWLAKGEVNYLYKAVALGNLKIYMDIYWQHLAYHYGGIEEIKRCHSQGDITDKVLAAWVLLDEGKKTGNKEQIQKANVDILEYEQKVVVQPLLYAGDRNQRLWELATITHKLSGILLTSPVPGEKRGFRDCVPNGNIGNSVDRWKWCTEHIMPNWYVYESKYPKRVEILLRKVTAGR